ncbi:MAG: GNAT family N-acetyltransferase [Firmicutes bacterium]|nr:GNAT family N-acetyltransferase [Bacillota bacterium]
MHKQICLESSRLQLKELDSSSAAAVLAYYQQNSDFLAPWESARDEEFYTVSEQQNQLLRDSREMAEGRLFKVWIYEKGKPSIIGFIALNNIVRGSFQSCHVGYKLAGQSINQGLMTEGLEQVIRYAFTELHLHRIEANIMPHNVRSMRVVEKLHFYHEGVAQKYLRINGTWEDHVHMVLRNHALE